MTRKLLLTVLLIGACLAAVQAADEPPAFASYSLVVLMRGPAADKIPADKLEEILQAHLAHLRAMGESGKMLVAGPLGDQPDPSWRGLCLYRTSLEEARQLAEADPAVQAGRLRVEVMTWYVEDGALAFPKAVPPRD